PPRNNQQSGRQAAMAQAICPQERDLAAGQAARTTDDMRGGRRPHLADRSPRRADARRGTPHGVPRCASALLCLRFGDLTTRGDREGEPMTKISTATRAAIKHEFPNLARDVKQFPVRDGEEPWTLREVEELAALLLEDKERLERELHVADKELSDLLRNSGDGAGDDQADYGSSALEREQELTLVNNMRDLLEQRSEEHTSELQSRENLVCR